MKWTKIKIAIVCVTILETVALIKGVNGGILRIVVAAIMCMVGLATKTPKIMEKLIK